MQTHELAIYAIRWRRIAEMMLAVGDGSTEHADVVQACGAVADSFELAHALRCELAAMVGKRQSLWQAALGAFVLAVVFACGAAAAALVRC